MCWTKAGERYLCEMTESEARAKVLSIIKRHEGKTLLQFMKIYAPPNENDYSHYYCVSKNSEINLNTKI